jgi:hypothetical protein
MPPTAADGQDFPACRARASEPAPYPGTPITAEGGEQKAGPGTAPAPRGTDFPGLVSLLCDGARAAACGWDRLGGRQEHDFAVISLATILRDLSVLSARLSACFRLRAMSEPAPAAFARAASVHAAAQFTGQAWLLLSDAGIPVPAETGQDCTPAGLMCHAARCAAAWPQPAMGPGVEIMQPLAEAMSVLASGAGTLAASAAEPLAAILTAVGVCVDAAASQLNGICLSAAAADPARWPGRAKARGISAIC